MEEKRNKEKMEENVNDFEGKENLCKCEVGLRNIIIQTWRDIRLQKRQIYHFNLLTNTTRIRSTNPKNYLKFIHTFKSMYSDVDTHTKKDRKWKNKIIALNDMS